MAKLFNYNRQGYKTPMPVLDPVERANTFAEVTLGYDVERAVNEARRCIQCSSKPCVAGCPVGVPVREFVAHIARRDLPGAYAAVKDANALPAICGRVCPQETQCEGVCMRGRKGEPVGIGRLERFIADWAADHREEANRALAERRAERARRDAALDDAGEFAALGGKAVPTIPPGVDLTGCRVAMVGSARRRSHAPASSPRRTPTSRCSRRSTRWAACSPTASPSSACRRALWRARSPPSRTWASSSR